MTTKSIRLVCTAASYAPGDVAAFDDSKKANRFILSGVDINAVWNTAGPGGTPLKGVFIAGRPTDAVGWKYQGPAIGTSDPSILLGA